MDFVCTVCGRRQEHAARCSGCGDDSLLDLREVRTREFLREIDMRAALKREGQIRGAAVVGGLAILFGLWLIPGYWHERGRIYPGLPLFADQWIIATLIAFGLIRVLESVAKARPRFPFIDDAGELRDRPPA